MSKKKEIRLGNFKITREKMVFEYIKVEAISGIWNMKFRSDNPYYPILDEMLKSEDAHRHLHNSIAMNFLIANGLKDMRFIEDVITAYNEFVERTKEKPLSETEDQAIINEEKEKHEDRNQI